MVQFIAATVTSQSVFLLGFFNFRKKTRLKKLSTDCQNASSYLKLNTESSWRRKCKVKENPKTSRRWLYKEALPSVDLLV